MSQLAEEIVEERLNRQGYFTIRRLRLGVDEIDLLAIRPASILDGLGKGKKAVVQSASGNDLLELVQMGSTAPDAAARKPANAGKPPAAR